MIVLKGQALPSVERVLKFVKENNILKENILQITHGQSLGGTPTYTIFFYGDSEVEEKVPGFWG